MNALNNSGKLFILLFFLTLAGGSGCSFKSIALRSTVGILAEGLKAFYEESDVRFAEESAAGQLKLLEVLIKNDPDNSRLAFLAAQGFGSYAFLFLEGQDPQRAKIFYERGRSYGFNALRTKMSADDPAEMDLARFEEGLQKLGRDEAPLLFWTAYCWGGLANLSRDQSQSLAELPKIERCMMRVNEISPGYFYGGADLFMGSYYGSRPKMFGGDLEKAKFYFDRAAKISDGKFLTVWLLYAQYVGIPSQDKELFKALLEKILDFSGKSFPEQRLSNEIAKIKAKKLMEEMDEHF